MAKNQLLLLTFVIFAFSVLPNLAKADPANPINNLVDAVNLPEINKKLQQDNLPQVNEEMINFILNTYNTSLDQLNEKLETSVDIAENVDIINNVLRAKLLVIRDEDLLVNFGGAFQVYRTVVNRYLREIFNSNYFMGLVASRFVRVYQTQYLPYFRNLCQSIRIPLNSNLNKNVDLISPGNVDLNPGIVDLNPGNVDLNPGNVVLNPVEVSRSLALKQEPNVFLEISTSVQRTISNIFENVISQIDGLTKRIVGSLQNYVVPVDDPNDILRGLYAFTINSLVNKSVDVVRIAAQNLLDVFRPFAIKSDGKTALQRTVTWFDPVLIPVGEFLMKVTEWIIKALNWMTFSSIPDFWLKVLVFFNGLIQLIFHVPHT